MAVVVAAAVVLRPPGVGLVGELVAFLPPRLARRVAASASGRQRVTNCAVVATRSLEPPTAKRSFLQCSRRAIAPTASSVFMFPFASTKRRYSGLPGAQRPARDEEEDDEGERCHTSMAVVQEEVLESTTSPQSARSDRCTVLRSSLAR